MWTPLRINSFEKKVWAGCSALHSQQFQEKRIEVFCIILTMASLMMSGYSYDFNNCLCICRDKLSLPLFRLWNICLILLRFPSESGLTQTTCTLWISCSLSCVVGEEREQMREINNKFYLTSSLIFLQLYNLLFLYLNCKTILISWNSPWSSVDIPNYHFISWCSFFLKVRLYTSLISSVRIFSSWTQWPKRSFPT